MTEIKKYLFDNFVVGAEKKAKEEIPAAIEEAEETEEEKNATDFTEPEPIIPEEPTYSLMEVEEKERIAEEKGYEKGFRNASESTDAIIAAVLADINNKLSITVSDSCHLHDEVEKRFALMAKKFLTQTVPEIAEEHAAQIVEKFISDNFNNFKKESKLSFYIHPDIISYIQERISKLADINDFEGKISLIKDDKLAKTDCRVGWENGGVECKLSGVVDKVVELLVETGENK